MSNKKVSNKKVDDKKVNNKVKNNKEGSKTLISKKSKKFTVNKNVSEILELLDENYGTDVICYLKYNTDWQLLFSVILSAQCTDDRVNQVAVPLYEKYDKLSDWASFKPEELERKIYSIGFYRNKAKNIISCANDLLNRFDGKVPGTIEELTSLAGVGRKTANVIRGNLYDDPSIVVDTHVKRISNKLGFTKESDPVKIEYDLMKVLPKDHWILYNMQIITLGRRICVARRPKCSECFLREYCPSCEG